MIKGTKSGIGYRDIPLALTLTKERAMKLNMPMAVFGGLALIAAAIYFGSGSAPVSGGGHDPV